LHYGRNDQAQRDVVIKQIDTPGKRWFRKHQEQ
jgi:hypothetical protein